MSTLLGVSDHARQRFVERYGWCPSNEQWHVAVLSILDRKALLMASIQAVPGRAARERWRVAIGGAEVEVFWIPAGNVIATVAAPDHGAIKQHRHRRTVTSKTQTSRAYQRNRRGPETEDWA